MISPSPLPRRRFLLGAGALGLAACAPENGRPTLIEAEPAPAANEVETSGQVGQVLRSPSDSDPIAEPDRDLLDSLIDRSIVATALVETLQVFDGPDGAVTHEMPNPTTTGGPLIFLTEVNNADWHQVLLPVRPNGATGWIRNNDVELTAHQFRIEVDLGDFRFRIFERGVVIFDAVAGVAADNSPTPGGRYYITELLAPTVPDSVYGSFAYGLSGFSETFETFNGGPGQLGIHGTNSPETLGSQVSSGCIRLHNDDISRIVQYLPLGVPVEVR